MTARFLLLAFALSITGFGSLAGQGNRNFDVRVDDLTLYLTCSGSGSPTVVFESGTDEDSALWGQVRQRLARTMRACAYDRAGIGRSGGPAPKFPLDLTRQFWSMLDAAGVDDPIILVGHGFGGYLARIHAGGRPGRIVGMVLVDPTTETFTERAKALLPAEEWAAWDASERDVRALAQAMVPPAGPVRVLSSGQTGLPEAPEAPADHVEALRAAWRDGQAAYAASVPNGRHTWLPNSGHLIPLENPTAVVSEILEVLRTAPQP